MVYGGLGRDSRAPETDEQKQRRVEHEARYMQMTGPAVSNGQKASTRGPSPEVTMPNHHAATGCQMIKRSWLVGNSPMCGQQPHVASCVLASKTEGDLQG